MVNTTIIGSGDIKATIIAHSKNKISGKEIITYELEYHRYIHAELMTHRMFSRNSMSSRAIPIERMLDLVETSPAVPIHWGAKQAGMQADNECTNEVDLGYGNVLASDEAWFYGIECMKDLASAFDKAGYHKQIVNRLLEPFQMIKVIVTSTCFDNFFNLRLHKDAQPEIKELATCMYKAFTSSKPRILSHGEWHLPYYKNGYWSVSADLSDDYDSYGLLDQNKHLTDEEGITLEQAIKISCSCCAQVSYRKNDDSLEKANLVFDRLILSEPVHASAFEHCATPNPDPFPKVYIDDTDLEWKSGNVSGVTHVDISGNAWSGNFIHWIQYRQLIPNNVCNKYIPS